MKKVPETNSTDATGSESHPRPGLLCFLAWPGAISLSLIYYCFVLAGDPALVASRSGIPMLMVLLLGLLLEQLIPLRADWKKSGDKMIPSDILHAAFHQVMQRLAALIFPIAALASADLVSTENSLALWPVDLPYPLQVLLLVFLADGVAYWLHRFTHEIPWLWSIHVVHHAPDRLNLFKAARHHAAYMVIRYFVVLVPFVLLGAPPGLVIWYLPFLAMVGPLSHANADLRVPHFMDRILLTPQVHQLHHSLDMRQGNSNYAVIFPVWDVIFGTFCDPAKESTRAVGVPCEPLPRGFLYDLVRPFVPNRRQIRERAQVLGRRTPL